MSEKHKLYNELSNCPFEDRQQLLNSIFGDAPDCKYKKNLLYSEIYDVMMYKLGYYGLVGFDYDSVANSILIEIERTQLSVYAEKDVNLQAVLTKIAKHCIYENIAEKKGISCNDLQKLVEIRRISAIENIPIETENAWLFQKFLPKYALTPIIRAIENHKMITDKNSLELDKLFAFEDDELPAKHKKSKEIIGLY